MLKDGVFALTLLSLASACGGGDDGLMDKPVGKLSADEAEQFCLLVNEDFGPAREFQCPFDGGTITATHDPIYCSQGIDRLAELQCTVTVAEYLDCTTAVANDLCPYKTRENLPAECQFLTDPACAPGL